MSFKQKFKATFQPLEIGFKKALGIKKVKKGRLFDEVGFVADGREKTTRYALFVPFYQRAQTIVGVSEFTNSAVKTGGGGEHPNHSGDDSLANHAANPTKPNAHLYTIRTIYRVFGIALFRRTYTKIHSHAHATTPFNHTIYATIGEEDFCNIGKYATKSPNLTQEIAELTRGLSLANKKAVLRQIALSIKAYKSNDSRVLANHAERVQLAKIHSEFEPNILEFSENLFAYDGYFLPINHFEASVFWYRHSLEVLEKSTLAKMRCKDFIDVGGFVGDSAIIFEREFCDKNIYTFEATSKNFNLMQETLRLNDSKRIIPVNLGLGAEKSTMTIKLGGSGSTIGGSADYLTGETETTQIITLDEFVAERKIEVGFIKVDIEGFEMEFLKGAKNTICAQKPAMLLSIYHSGRDFFKIKPLIESWNLGYSFKIHKGVDGSVTGETALFCEILG